MIRITFHLSGVTPYTQELKKLNKNTESFEYTKKVVVHNTIALNCPSESAGLIYMNNYVNNRKGVRVTKHYFSNIN
jgi:hypothetical protein